LCVGPLATSCEQIGDIVGLPIFKCEREVLSAETSPDGVWVAEQTSVMCGATTRDAIQVSIRPADGSPGDGKVIATVEGDAPLGVVWRDGSVTLGPTGSSHQRLFQNEPSRGSMRIRLHAAEQPARD
jgi:hypothetical protein